MLELVDKPAPDLLPALEPATGSPSPAPGDGLTLADLDAGLTALVDREDLAGPDERARLRRVRDALERQAARLLEV